MNITAVQNSVNHKVTRAKPVSLTDAYKEELIHVEIVSTDAGNIKMLQAYLSKLGHIAVLNIHKSVKSFLCTLTECAVLFVDVNMMNEDLLNETKLRSPKLKIIGMSSRQRFEKNNQDELPFYFLRLPAISEELIPIINLLKICSSVLPVFYETKKYLLVKSEYKIIKINFDDILFIAGMKDYVRIHLKTRSMTVTTLQNLKDFEKKLPPIEFIRVHKSYIVAAQHIDCIAKNVITIANHSIPVGEAFRGKMHKFISENS